MSGALSENRAQRSIKGRVTNGAALRSLTTLPDARFADAAVKLPDRPLKYGNSGR